MGLSNEHLTFLKHERDLARPEVYLPDLLRDPPGLLGGRRQGPAEEHSQATSRVHAEAIDRKSEKLFGLLHIDECADGEAEGCPHGLVRGPDLEKYIVCNIELWRLP